MSISPPNSPGVFEVPVFEDGGDGVFDGGDPQSFDEQALVVFEDEAPIQHDEVPVQSDSDCKDDFRGNVSFDEGRDAPVKEFEIGQTYYGKDVVQRLVLAHALNTGRNVKKYRHDTTKIGFICVGTDCHWKLYAAKIQDSEKWEIRIANNEHTCLPNGECKLLKVTDIARLFIDKIRDEPEGSITPYVAAMLAKSHETAQGYIVSRGTNNKHMVVKGISKHRVCLTSRSCTCMKWDLRGIPCEHAYAVIIEKKLRVEDFVLHWFRKQTWQQTYSEGIGPNQGARFSPKVPGPVIQRPPSPPQPGRAKKNKNKKQKRIKEVNESPSKKQPKLMKRNMHCRICKEPNHNSRGCKKMKTSQSQGEPSQSQEVPNMLSQQV